MTRTQLRDMPRQDIIEYARRFEDPLIRELAERLEDCGRTDDYPFNSGDQS